MRYTYYPGCAGEGTGKAYDISTRAMCDKLGIELHELKDWNCCGATSYFNVRELTSFAIAARNLALAKEMSADELVVVCNACYTTLSKTNRYMADSPKTAVEVNEALAQVGRNYDGSVNVRHMMDVLVNDYGLDAFVQKVTRRLTGLKVAPYYGCQFSRPMGTFDDPEFPVTMDQLFAACGADVVDYPVKTKCCGGMMMMTKSEGALQLCFELLKCAQDNGAEVIVAACPLCEMSLEAYQPLVNKKYDTHFNIPVMYFTQLAGLALGIEPKALALDKQVMSVKPVLAAIPA